MIMASKCKKVKTPCKICLGQVTRKSGIQCEGACASWVHYKCLGYTPGKISDIKRGLIFINCPCPDCKTEMPKETFKDEPFSCTNAYCPANMPPKCINAECPSNAMCPPPGHNNLHAIPEICPMPCTVDTCKTAKVSPTTKQSSCCSGGDIKKVKRVTQTRSPWQLKPRKPPPQQCPPPMCQQLPPCAPRSRAPTSKSRQNSNQATKQNTAALKAMEKMCNTMGQLTCQLNNLMDKMQTLTVPASSPTTTMTSSCSLSELPCCCPGGGQPSKIKKKQSRSLIPSTPPPCCLLDQEDSDCCFDSPSPCFCPSNPLRRFC